jgi:hypothetical protein
MFAASLETLRSYPDSYFGSLFQGEDFPEEELFIDRDPFVFGHVLNYIRGRLVELFGMLTFRLPKLKYLTAKEIDLLQEDAEFYSLPSLSAYLKTFYLFSPGHNYSLSSDGLWHIGPF